MTSVVIIKIAPDGTLSLEPATFLQDSLFGCLELPGMNASIGPMFIRKINSTTYFSFVLEYNSENQLGAPNVYSSRFLDVSCDCGHEEHGHIHKGDFYLVKHDTSIKGVTHVDCNQVDLNFIKKELTQKWYHCPIS